MKAIKEVLLEQRETECVAWLLRMLQRKQESPHHICVWGRNYFCIFILTGEDTGALNIKDVTCTYYAGVCFCVK